MEGVDIGRAVPPVVRRVDINGKGASPFRERVPVQDGVIEVIAAAVAVAQVLIDRLLHGASRDKRIQPSNASERCIGLEAQVWRNDNLVGRVDAPLQAHGYPVIIVAAAGQGRVQAVLKIAGKVLRVRDFVGGIVGIIKKNSSR